MPLVYKTLRGVFNPTLQKPNYNKHHYNILEILYYDLIGLAYDFYLKHWKTLDVCSANYLICYKIIYP